MKFLRTDDMGARASRRARGHGLGVPEALRRLAQRRLERYDIFLSQTTRDAEIVLGVYDLLTSNGYAVFCDWIDAPETDRSQVTPANAAFVRAPMVVSDTLLFLDTEGSVQFLWMCWELGWFDGARGPVAILPVLKDAHGDYRGREFLGLYPYVELGENGRLKVVRPVVMGLGEIMMFEAPNSRRFDSWRADPRDAMRPASSAG